jgi:hypothetical protein
VRSTLESLAELTKNLITAARLEKRLVRSSKDIEDEIFELVRRLMLQFDIRSGQFVPESDSRLILATLNREIQKIIERTELESEMRGFLDDFDQIDANIRAVQQSLNGIRVAPDIFTQQKQWIVDSVLNSLLEANVNLSFINPVKQLLYSRAAFGGSVVDAERQLRLLIKGDEKKYGVLQRWVGQTARDAVNQYTGTINQQIKVQYELTAIRYVGGLVEDSRDQCRRWVTDFKGYLRDADLPFEIEWAYKNGSGMMPDTTPENFCQKRGGYNCLHECIPVREKK